jgi:NAD(P)-dependent dehydrogenase (short-subunit alcohol dehydrogenase family)
MKDFEDKVAVITGASGGIGFGIAERCAQEGMKVVLAGINLQNLIQAEAQLQPVGATTLCVRTDVSKLEDIQALADATLDAFGAVHLLVNNAGVVAGGTAWESTLADWQWLMGVNLWGVIYGLQVFVPIMLAQDAEAHIVNTSSVAGLMRSFVSAPYQVTKHAVVALTENLYHTLAQQEAKVKASVLCPGWVKTRILDSGRNRPPELQNEPRQEPVTPETQATRDSFRQAVEAGMSPQEVADHVFKAIRDEQLYILTHPDCGGMVQTRMQAILDACW